VDELLGFVEQLIAYIEANANSLNQETQQALTELLQNVFELINESNRIIGGGSDVERLTGGGTINLPESGPSSNIESFGYDEKNGNLMVRFLGDHPNRNGPIYSYQGVPKQIFDLFRIGAVPARTDGQNEWGEWWKGKVPSLGASLHTLIKGGGYPYQRLS
jgi:KTSC domain